MVVGHQQAVAGDELAGAAAAELDDGILDGCVVDAVDLLGREAGAEVTERVAVHLLDQGKKPHSLVGAQGGRHQEECGGDRKEDLFHINQIK